MAAKPPRAITLHSPLSPAECRARLAADMDPPGTLFGKRPLIGRFEGDMLSARKRIDYRNSFRTECGPSWLRRDAGRRWNAGSR